MECRGQTRSVAAPGHLDPRAPPAVCAELDALSCDRRSETRQGPCSVGATERHVQPPSEAFRVKDNRCRDADPRCDARSRLTTYRARTRRGLDQLLHSEVTLVLALAIARQEPRVSVWRHKPAPAEASPRQGAVQDVALF
jgi:hypothetical protein